MVNLPLAQIGNESWESAATDRNWRQAGRGGIKKAEGETNCGWPAKGHQLPSNCLHM